MSNKIKKTIFVLNVDNYAPEITELTYPLIKKYANKIGADFFEITERKYPKLPPVYEKMQIYELGKKMGNDWNIYIDSDALIHPDMFDMTEFLSKDTVCHNGNDMANNRWRYDEYFRRDGRHIGSCNWFAVASDWCIDLWHPLDIPYEEALGNIFPVLKELNTVITREHLIDDYMLSRNIARFGLKFKSLIKIKEEIRDPGEYLWHQYIIGATEKVEQMKNILCIWEATDYKDPKIEGWMSLPELSWLYLMAKDMDSIVEVGAWKGKGTHALASGCKGVVHSVDDFSFSPSSSYASIPETYLIPAGGAPSVDIEKIFRKNTKNFPNVDLIRSDSISASKRFEDNSVDMVWIDGAHDYDSVMKDIKAWLPKCKKLLCGHDLDHEAVQKALFDCHLKPAIGPERIWYIAKK